MFDRSAILRKAWAAYRAQVESIPGFKFRRKLFAQHLRSAWHSAKATARYIAQCEAEANVPAPVRAIRSELLSMELSDAPIDWDRHRFLSVQLFRASTELPAASP